MPKVSVLMPVYKTNEVYLREAIESILAQSFTDFEFLILDDCPEDDREAIVKSYDDVRIKYWKNDKNLGISASRNKLIDLAQGTYLAVFDHDDVSVPTRLEKEVSFLDSHPEVGVVSGQEDCFLQRFVTDFPEFNLDIKRNLMCANVCVHTAMMIRKSVLDRTGIRYEADYSPAEDYMLCLRLVGETMFYNFQEVLVQYRSFDGNTTHLRLAQMQDADARCRCFAMREYPYLYVSSTDRVWVKLFGVIPFLKIKRGKTCVRYRLFGCLTLFSVALEK
jgi:glycosyltransferase involved in cell wall biosynthesis